MENMTDLQKNIKGLTGETFRNIYELDNALQALDCWSVFDELPVDDLIHDCNASWQCKNGYGYIITFTILAKLKKAFDAYYNKKSIEGWKFMDVLEASKIKVTEVTEY